MVHLPIALQLFSVRDDMAADFAGTLEKVKAIGYDGVEFAGLCGNTPEQARKLCEAAGLVPVSSHVALQELEADPDGAAEKYAALGIRNLVIPYLLDEYRPGGSRYIPTTRGYGDSKSVQELEEFIIARVAALMFDKYLDIENNPLAETARKNGKTLRALDLRFHYTEGVLKGTVTGYSSRERSPGSQLFSLPNDMTFDWRLSDAGCERTAKCAVHDLARMRDMTLSHIAERRPDAFLSGDVLRSA